MQRNSYALAALADAAVPGLAPVRTVPIATPLAELEVAGVIGADGRRVVVSAPGTAAAGAHLEKDVHVSEALAGTSLAPFIPQVIGSTPLKGQGRAVVTEPPQGIPVLLDALLDSVGLARSLGRVLARIHSTPNYIAESAGAEPFTPQETRARHRTQIARARSADELPAAVQQRWEALLADDELWDFHPSFVHGSLSEECLFRRGDEISAVRDWHEAKVSDPAADLAWLVSALPPEQFDALYAAYRDEVAVAPHPRLLERAQALGEFAVVDWLLHGLDDEDESIADDAREMLADLDHDISAAARAEAEDAYEHLDTAQGPSVEPEAGQREHHLDAHGLDARGPGAGTSLPGGSHAAAERD